MKKTLLKESELINLIQRVINETQLLNEEINFTWDCAGSGPNRCLCTCKADNGCGTMTGNKIKDCKAHCDGHCLNIADDSGSTPLRYNQVVNHI